MSPSDSLWAFSKIITSKKKVFFMPRGEQLGISGLPVSIGYFSQYLVPNQTEWGTFEAENLLI